MTFYEFNLIVWQSKELWEKIMIVIMDITTIMAWIYFIIICVQDYRDHKFQQYRDKWIFK